MPAATGIAISSISVAAGTVTVNATAHGLAVNEGFSLRSTTGGTYDFNGTVLTATANSFTFAQGSLSAAGQAGAGGLVFPAKQVIVLATTQSAGSPELQVQYAMWLTTAQPIPAAGASAWTGASAKEVAAIAAGFVIERIDTKSFAKGDTKAAVQQELQNEYNQQQAALAAATQPGQFYGGYFDSGWSF